MKGKEDYSEENQEQNNNKIKRKSLYIKGRQYHVVMSVFLEKIKILGKFPYSKNQVLQGIKHISKYMLLKKVNKETQAQVIDDIVQDLLDPINREEGISAWTNIRNYNIIRSELPENFSSHNPNLLTPSSLSASTITINEENDNSRGKRAANDEQNESNNSEESNMDEEVINTSTSVVAITFTDALNPGAVENSTVNNFNVNQITNNSVNNDDNEENANSRGKRAANDEQNESNKKRKTFKSSNNEDSNTDEEVITTSTSVVAITFTNTPNLGAVENSTVNNFNVNQITTTSFNNNDLLVGEIFIEYF